VTDYVEDCSQAPHIYRSTATFRILGEVDAFVCRRCVRRRRAIPWLMFMPAFCLVALIVLLVFSGAGKRAIGWAVIALFAAFGIATEKLAEWQSENEYWGAGSQLAKAAKRPECDEIVKRVHGQEHASMWTQREYAKLRTQ